MLFRDRRDLPKDCRFALMLLKDDGSVCPVIEEHHFDADDVNSGRYLKVLEHYVVWCLKDRHMSIQVREVKP